MPNEKCQENKLKVPKKYKNNRLKDCTTFDLKPESNLLIVAGTVNFNHA